MKYLLLALSTASCLACSQPNNGNPKNKPDYMVFQFSKEMASTDMRDPANWCAARFGESVLISAAPDNYNRRLFALSDIPNRIQMDLGHAAASFMLCKVGDHVDIYTSDNLPACLSNKANFQISPEGTSFRYDNKKAIQFDVHLQELPNGLQIALDLPPGGGLGMSVVRCETCK
ncbi:MAG: hypothetical protein ACKVUS_00215 [Saprospiraceae bacterium]